MTRFGELVGDPFKEARVADSPHMVFGLRDGDGVLLTLPDGRLVAVVIHRVTGSRDFKLRVQAPRDVGVKRCMGLRGVDDAEG